MWIKICGTTSLHDAQLALDAGADALGFVFARSPRQVLPAQVRAITARLSPGPGLFGVFVDPSLEEVLAAVDEAGLNGVQLHHSSPRASLDTSHSSTGGPSTREQLRAYWAAHPPRVPVSVTEVVSYTPGALGAELPAQSTHRDAAHALMLDTRVPGRAGGTGQPFAWAQAAAELQGFPGLPRLIVAGGLHPHNVAEAIRTLQPWGVDVVSGVEAEPGRKDPERLRSFIHAARTAARAAAVAHTPGPKNEPLPRA